MNDLLQPLEGFLIGAIPTFILFVLLWIAYRFLVHRPLARVLAERYRRTQGALARAQTDIASAEAKTAEYENRLRQAKLEIFKAQEAARQQLAAQREAAAAQARERAHALLGQSRQSLAAELAAAKARLEQQAEELAGGIIRALLKPAAAGGGR